MIEPRPLIGVRNVAASSRWYQKLLDCRSGHGGDTYEQLVRDGRMTSAASCLGRPEDQHELMGDPRLPLGNGVLLWFRVEDFDAAVARAARLAAEYRRT